MTTTIARRRISASHEPLFAGNEWKYVKECLDTGWVSSAGKFVNRFESAMAERLNVDCAVATVNGTAALHLAMRVLDVGPQDEILLPSLTFIATGNSVLYERGVPCFIDVSPVTLGMDPDRLAAFLAKNAVRRGKTCVNKKTKRRFAACVVMHAFGHPVEMDRIVAVCDKYGIPVVEDAAEALGSSYLGKAAGSFGRLAALSFNGNKIITSGSGGMLLTSDPILGARARHLSTQAKSDPDRFWHDDVGYNYRLSNLNAALGLAQLEQLDSFLEKKRQVAKWYREALRGVAGVKLLWEPPKSRSNFWLNTIQTDSPQRTFELLGELNRQGLASRPVWAPCHRQKAFQGCPRDEMTVTDRLWRTCLNVPSSAALQREDVEAVARVVARS